MQHCSWRSKLPYF